MKIPVSPRTNEEIFTNLLEQSPDTVKETLGRIHNKVSTNDSKGRYLHWDKLRHLKPEYNLSNEHWWLGMRMARNAISEILTFKDKKGKHFKYCQPNTLQKDLHWLDLNTAGTMSSDNEAITNPSTRSTYLISSLVEEAINSSQLEGASTTKDVAKEMIRQGREPKDIDEQMILNNYYAMQFVREYKSEELTPAMIMHLHKILTEKTLETPDKAGRFRNSDDDIHVVDNRDGVILHTPPDAEELNDRINVLCDFANNKNDKNFIHPVIKAITLHFMLAYDHPFVDGNGRTARALFYWSMCKDKYWMMEFLAISKIIKSAPIKYGRAFLYSETDDNDLTYFIYHQIDIIKQAVESLKEYILRKTNDITTAENILQGNKKLRGKLNFRQLALLKHSLKHPRFTYNINEHKNSHGISYETARQDLLQMSDKLGLLEKIKSGKSFIFITPADLEERIKLNT